jgi:hypothetical protein
MDFMRPERCRRQRTGQEDRRSKFYEVSDNLKRTVERQLMRAHKRIREGGEKPNPAA